MDHAQNLLDIADIIELGVANEIDAKDLRHAEWELTRLQQENAELKALLGRTA